MGTRISGIGSDEFMNDTHLEHLIIRGKDTEPSGLSLILERIAENITVSFCPNDSSTPESILFFPNTMSGLMKSLRPIFSAAVFTEKASA